MSIAATVSLIASFLLGGTPQAAPVMLHVEAPTAQRLVVAEKSKHPEIVKLGLHATPPTLNDNVIIASDNPAKIGKKSSQKDMDNLAAGKPLAVRVEKDKIFDLMLPITDSKGGDLAGGFLVMEVPYSEANDEQEALRIGTIIRDELQHEIKSKSALYQP